MDFGVVSFDGFSSLDHDKTVTHDFSPSKVTKLTNDFSPSKNLHPKHSSFVLPDQVQEQNMLSFSSPKLEHKNLQNSAFQHFQHFSPTHCKSNAGYSSNDNEGVNARMCYINGVKWPFTTSQWLELEQQALIYKYIIANQPIPPHLLLPIQRALQSAAFCSFPAGLLSPNSYGWGPFQFGFSNNTDPEPGRCRRTDGKKWRCSRDAVPDQKYCERHINRGRHRSRKPVEAHSGLSLTKPTNVTNTNSSAHRNSNFSSSAASSTVSVNLNYHKESHSGAGIRNTGGLDFFSPANSLNSRDSILWQKPQAEPERTQLSISIPAAPAPADYRSSTSSPTGEKVTLSPLRLSRGIDPVQMGMGMGMGLGVGICQTKQTDSGWETCVGGPLGEVLKPTNNNLVSNGKSSLSGLSLLSAEWEVNQQMCSSPKGVFKGTAQGSVSNSSAGSSSRESSYVAPYL